MKHRIIKPINERSHKNKHIWSNKNIGLIKISKCKSVESLYIKSDPMLNMRYTSYLFRSFNRTHSIGGCKVKALSRKFKFDPSIHVSNYMKRNRSKGRKI